MTYDTELVELDPQPAAVVRASLTAAEIPEFLASAFGEVAEALAGQGLEPAGPPFGRYVPAGDGLDVEAGFPATGEVRPTGRVEPCELPGGPAARVLHRGAWSDLPAAYHAALDWAEAHNYVPAAPPWESYLDGPEVQQPRTVVLLPCHDGDTG